MPSNSWVVQPLSLYTYNAQWLGSKGLTKTWGDHAIACGGWILILVGLQIQYPIQSSCFPHRHFYRKGRQPLAIGSGRDTRNQNAAVALQRQWRSYRAQVSSHFKIFESFWARRVLVREEKWPKKRSVVDRSAVNRMTWLFVRCLLFLKGRIMGGTWKTSHLSQKIFCWSKCLWFALETTSEVWGRYW